MDIFIDSIDDYNLKRIIDSFPKDERDVLENKYADKLHAFSWKDVDKALGEDYQNEKLDDFKNKYIVSFSQIMGAVGDEERSKILGEVRLTSYELAPYICKISSDKLKLETLESVVERLDNYEIAMVIKSLGKSERVAALDKYVDRLDSFDIINIAKTLDEKEMALVVKKYGDRLAKFHLKQLNQILEEQVKSDVMDIMSEADEKCPAAMQQEAMKMLAKDKEKENNREQRVQEGAVLE